MYNFFTKLRALVDFLLAITLGYFALTTSIFPLLNIFLVVVAIFVLLQGCGNWDKANNYGPYNNSNNNQSNHQNIYRHQNSTKKNSDDNDILDP